jgi:hypothetical protein
MFQVAPPDQQRGLWFGLRLRMHRSKPMLDILMIAIAFGLFAAGIGYAYVCERL